MPAPLPWSVKDSSVLLALQSSLTAPNTTDGDFVALACSALVPKFETETTEFDLLKGQVGAEPEVVVGRRKGSVEISMPVEGFKDGYDPTAENPGGAPVGSVEVIPPWFAWLGNILGSHIDGISTGDPLSTQNTNFWRGQHLSCNEYTAAGVTAAGTDSTHVTLDNATASDKIKAGELVVTALDAASQPQIGFVKTKLAQLLTLFEASQATVASNAANVYGSATAWVSDEKQRPMTMRWTGESANLCYELTGLMISDVELTLDAGAITNVKFTGTYEDYQVRQADGGLVVPDAYERAPAIIGAHGGALMLSGTDTQYLEQVVLKYSCTLRRFKGHSAEQGIAAVVPVRPRVRMSFSVPHDNADGVYDATGSVATEGSHVWQSRFEQGASLSMGIYVGPQVGRCLAVRLPNATVKATPEAADREELLAYGITIGAEAYSGDSTDTAETSADAPIDAILSISLA